ncbi:MAG: APC family permease [Candidatus Dependentiae bacterium]|nr:APC family permease [Candidatus Dependentiae bacterium]
MKHVQQERAQLSLASAILINVNIMLGSGIFINNVTLARTAGPLSVVSYPLVGLLLIPLIAIFSLLLRYHEGATFYELGEVVHPVLGFVSSWGYFIGKLASCALSIHVSVSTAQLLLPALEAYSTLVIDLLVLGIFLLLNLYNIKTERPIQYLFVSLKSIPVLIVIGAAIALFNPSNLAAATGPASALLSAVPLVLFGFAGFEASCSLSKNIRNPSRNGPLAIIISFGIVLVAMSLFQLGLFAALGPELATYGSFQLSIQTLISRCFTLAFLQKTVLAAAFVGIASSALGASYSILYSNVWNLHTLAGYHVIPWANRLRRCNRFAAPSACIVIASAIVATYLLLSRGNNLPLQQVSAAATTTTYSISVLSFLFLSFGTIRRHRLLATLGVCSCALFIVTAFVNAYSFGAIPYALFGLVVAVGLSMRTICTRSGRCKVPEQ